VLFERETQRALARRPPHGYRTEDQSLPVVRGRIRLVDQALRRFGALTPIEVTVDEWTLDTDDNRRLRAATHVLLGLPGVPKRTADGLRRVDRMLTGVRPPPGGARLPPWTATRLNADLHRLLHLTDLVLAGVSVEHRSGDVVAHCFALNMAWVFETLVAQILDEQWRRHGPGQLLKQRPYSLDRDARLTIRPDLVVADGAWILAVADTKYKLLDDTGAFPNADAYQLVTYCLRLGLPVGHLIYAGDASDQSFSYDIVGADVSLSVQAIDLKADLSDIERQIGAVLASIRFLATLSGGAADRPRSASMV